MRKNIFNSATKIVLLYIIFILGILAIVAGLWSIITGDFSEVAKAVLAMFQGVISYVMGYYFGSKGETGTAAGGK